ncbi:polyribonucleotide nucleotidyltransferase [candidate division NPL-UPA2 bacterium]|nr:polyribonucleotide nucleotidyltransferase [candidate division NPL-UPA2 bacterium]
MDKRVEIELGGRNLSMETGRMAKLADGAAVVQYGDTIVLVTAVASREVREDVDYLPLFVDYREKTYAAGKIPGGFFKREGRPSEKEVLTARLIDRPLRPLFPPGFRNEVQIMAIVLSADAENDPDILAIIGGSAALALSDIPMAKPVGAVRVGREGGKFILNPTHAQVEEGELDLVVAGSKDGINMVEGGARQLSEEVIQEALLFGHQAVRQIIGGIEQLVEAAGKRKRQFELFQVDEEIKSKVGEFVRERITEVINIADKKQREELRRTVEEETLTHFAEIYPDKESEIKAALEEIEKKEVRHRIIEGDKRVDGRTRSEIRPISCQVGMLPRTHGSAIFSRGQTQSLVVITLGTAHDEQILDQLTGESSKAFMLHYNFPPFSVGEIKPVRGPGRREIGHGALAERALRPLLPSNDKFPYTIRIVSDILESNGSSSMATVCGGSLSLMDAGVPIKAPVAGIAMGLVREGEKAVVLTDIAGLEDYFGDMDLKISGTRDGITAIQMDIKGEGVTPEILKEAFGEAKTARLTILDKMEEVIREPRPQISPLAPHIIVTRVPLDKVGTVIGPGGKTIRGIIEKTGAEIDIEDDGEITISAPDEEGVQKALKIIESLTAEAEIGKIYLGKVKKITDFGAFVEIFPGQEGLVHISQLADYHVKRVEDEVKVGEEILVKVIDIDPQGKIRLSRKAATLKGTGTREKRYEKKWRRLNE